jgi:ParB family transcriptional regulator, chromosome partitioning protein
LAVGLLKPGRFQPRTRMDPQSIAELADSIKAQGLIQPILVRPVENGKYEIIAGERRWRASQLAGLTQVPVVVRNVPDKAALAMALIENIQREDLNPLEEATGIQRLVDEFEMTHEVAAQAVGRSRSAVTNLLRLLNLSKAVQDLLMQGKIEMGHARALLTINGSRQAELAHQIISRNLSVREAEQLVGQTETTSRKTPRKQPRKDRDLQALEEELSEILGTTVTVKTARGGRGKLTIDYASLDQLDNVLQKLRR